MRESLIPGLDVDALSTLLSEGRWRVLHGPLERLPEFLQPDDGALSSIGKLRDWPHFDVAYRDGPNAYRQVRGEGQSATAHYDRGGLVTSRSIEKISDAAKAWLVEWAALLGVSAHNLRLNSWAVRGTGGINWHFDREDVIHFQIKGDKLFKLLGTSATRFADAQTKKFERIMVAQRSFDDASEELVRAGTITIIPRGVWHWSEAKSDESFAVSLCVSPESYAQTLSQALYRRLRLVEGSRMPLLGSQGFQKRALEACIKEAGKLLQSLNVESVLAEEGAREFPVDAVSASYFCIGMRANASLKPLRMLVDGKELAIADDEEEQTILEAICELGQGFRLTDVTKRVPHADESTVNGLLLMLVRAGFLDFLDAHSAPGGEPHSPSGQ